MHSIHHIEIFNTVSDSFNFTYGGSQGSLLAPFTLVLFVTGFSFIFIIAFCCIDGYTYRSNFMFFLPSFHIDYLI